MKESTMHVHTCPVSTSTKSPGRKESLGKYSDINFENFRFPMKHIPMESRLEAVGNAAVAAISRTDIPSHHWQSASSSLSTSPSTSWSYLFRSSVSVEANEEAFLHNSPSGKSTFRKDSPLTPHRKYDWSFCKSAAARRRGEFPQDGTQVCSGVSSRLSSTHNAVDVAVAVTMVGSVVRCQSRA